MENGTVPCHEISDNKLNEARHKVFRRLTLLSDYTHDAHW